MTMQNDDEQIDAMVRAASAFPVDEDRLTQGVLRRIRDDDGGLFGLFGQRLRGAAFAFGCVLAATPVLMMQLPSDADDAVIAALLLGEGMLDDFAGDALFADEAVE
jgi:hypothetical protein